MATDVEAKVQQAQAVLLREAGSQEAAPLAVSKAITEIIPAAYFDGKMRLLTTQEKSLLELGARAALASMATFAVEARRPVMEWSLEANAPPTVPRLLDMFLLITEHKWSDAGLVFTLMEDLVETSTKQDCSGVFAYLEGQAALLVKPRAQASGRFTMLRICNALLRRLSKSHDAVLCGRILIFLAQLQPLSDRSGLNVQAAFNTANVTAVEDVPEGTTDSNGDPIDKEFYIRFWGLQSVFQRPVEAMVAGPWLRVMADLKAVAVEFDKLKLVASAPAAPDASGPLPAVKYLSSSKLMRLQLQDSGFRRQFLVQALIFLHCCRHPGRSEKAAALKPKQEEEAEALEAALYRQLEATPEQGTEFAAAIRAVLDDETAWVQWKNVLPASSVPGAPVKAEVCPSFERLFYTPPLLQPLLTATQVPSRKRNSANGQQVMSGSNSKRLRVGTPALDRLWNQAPNNMAGLKVSERRHLPTLREFLNPVIEDMDPENDIEDAYRRKHDKAYQWKALRMISRESLSVFAKTAIDSDLEVAARALYPSEVPPRLSTPVTAAAHSMQTPLAALTPSPLPAGSPALQSDRTGASQSDAAESCTRQTDSQTPAVSQGQQAPASGPNSAASLSLPAALTAIGTEASAANTHTSNYAVPVMTEEELPYVGESAAAAASIPAIGGISSDCNVASPDLIGPDVPGFLSAATSASEDVPGLDKALSKSPVTNRGAAAAAAHGDGSRPHMRSPARRGGVAVNSTVAVTASRKGLATTPDLVKPLKQGALLEPRAAADEAATPISPAGSPGEVTAGSMASNTEVAGAKAKAATSAPADAAVLSPAGSPREAAGSTKKGSPAADPVLGAALKSIAAVDDNDMSVPAVASLTEPGTPGKSANDAGIGVCEDTPLSGRKRGRPDDVDDEVQGR